MDTRVSYSEHVELFVTAQNISGALHLLSDALHHESAYETRTAIIMPQQGTHFSKCNAVLLRNHDFEQLQFARIFAYSLFQFVQIGVD